MAGYLRGAWERFRKYGGLPTGISQNVAEIIANESTQSIVSNSEFIFMLEQSAEDKKELIRICNISEDQEQYITNNIAGHGLLCAGENPIPFNAEMLR